MDVVNSKSQRYTNYSTDIALSMQAHYTISFRFGLTRKKMCQNIIVMKKHSPVKGLNCLVLFK